MTLEVRVGFAILMLVLWVISASVYTEHQTKAYTEKKKRRFEEIFGREPSEISDNEVRHYLAGISNADEFLKAQALAELFGFDLEE